MFRKLLELYGRSSIVQVESLDRELRLKWMRFAVTRRRFFGETVSFSIKGNLEQRRRRDNERPLVKRAELLARITAHLRVKADATWICHEDLWDVETEEKFRKILQGAQLLHSRAAGVLVCPDPYLKHLIMTSMKS